MRAAIGRECSNQAIKCPSKYELLQTHIKYRILISSFPMMASHYWGKVKREPGGSLLLEGGAFFLSFKLNPKLLLVLFGSVLKGFGRLIRSPDKGNISFFVDSRSVNKPNLYLIIINTIFSFLTICIGSVPAGMGTSVRAIN